VSFRILLIDDEPAGRAALAELLRDEGFEVEEAGSAEAGLERVDAFDPAVVITDMRMPGKTGLDVVRALAARDQSVASIVLTGHGEVENAVEAMRLGARDYISKPVDFAELKVSVDAVVSRQKLQRDLALMRGRVAEREGPAGLIGSSEPMEEVVRLIEQVAPSRATVLITGESGTGKELVATAVHRLSQRNDGPFVRVHCAALAETLLESELFGHEKGAFTGADRRRDGRFASAHGGTLFLDEIGEISPAVQVKLLRFLQEREFERVGGGPTIRVDVRLVTATNRDLEQEVKDGRFREDLFYRLNVINIRVPPLRERPTDIPLLAHAFLRRFASENEKKIAGFTADALAAMTSHPWRGNVRELENCVERAVVMCRGDVVELGDLPTGVGPSSARGANGEPEVPGARLDELERHAILQTLEACGGSTSRAAKILGISVRKIQYRLREYSDAPPADVDPVE